MEVQGTKTLLTELADFYASLGPGDIPGTVLEKARRVLMDFLCETAAGFHEGELASIAIEYARETGGREEATILCDGSKVPAPWAALARGSWPTPSSSTTDTGGARPTPPWRSSPPCWPWGRR